MNQESSEICKNCAVSGYQDDLSILEFLESAHDFTCENCAQNKTDKNLIEVEIVLDQAEAETNISQTVTKKRKFNEDESVLLESKVEINSTAEITNIHTEPLNSNNSQMQLRDKIIQVIWKDLKGRKFMVDDLPNDIQKEIQNTWKNLLDQVLKINY